jgi:hypothetical protein
MRARNIKPGFFKNEYLAECSPLARLLFAGLWCMADREGRLEYRPKRIKAEILPYDSCSIEKMVDELCSKNFVQLYSVNGDNYINIINFHKHQNPHVRESESSCPAPDKHSAEHNLGDAEHRSSPADSPILIPDSPILIPDSPIGRVRHSKYSAEFETFWKAYPRKVKKEKAWEAWRKRNGTMPPIEDVVKAIETQKKCSQWIRDGGQYIPHPATWINGGQWMDESDAHPLSGKVSDKTIRNMEMLKEWSPPL